MKQLSFRVRYATKFTYILLKCAVCCCCVVALRGVTFSFPAPRRLRNHGECATPFFLKRVLEAGAQENL